jgi:hypothetical protein
MIANINNWKISFVNENKNIEKLLLIIFEKKPTTITYLLNTNISKYSIIEKFVYEIAMFHFNRMNIEFDDNKYIEFCFKNTSSNEDNSYHFDFDEYDRLINNPKKLITPLLSCVIYLDDIEIPTLITNIDRETYVNNSYSDKNTLVLSYPKFMKHITFDGGKNLHGTLKIVDNNNEKRFILSINLWDKRPLYVPYFDHLMYMNMLYRDKIIEYKCEIDKLKDYDMVVEKNDKLIDIHLDMKNTKTIELKNNDIINPDFFKNIFLKNKYDKISKLYEIIKKDLKNFDTFCFNLTDKKYNNQDKSENNQIMFSREFNMFDINSPKFKQRFILTDIFSSSVCDWIVKEFEKNNKSENMIKIENLENVFSLIIETISSILEKITKCYSFNENEINYNIIDATITKNIENIETKNYDMKVSILLNDDFEGGGFYFEDEITTFLEKGSMIIHNSKIKNSKTEITKGNQYILQIYVQFIKIN